ncbi:MAG: copper resistance CopC family protein [Actinomycetes bacterium]
MPRRFPRSVASLASTATALLALLGCGVLGASPASAHASLVRASPADGSTVTSAPTEVTLTFDEALGASPAVIVVTDASGRRVSTGATVVRGSVISTAVRITTGGTFTVAFRAVSDDGHPVADRTTFRVAGAVASSPAASAPAGSPPATTAAGAAQQAGGAGSSGTHTWLIVGGAAAVLLAGVALLTLGRRRPSADHSKNPA